MSIPDYQSLMKPMLRIFSDGGVHSIQDITALLAGEFNLSEEEKNAMLPSGRQGIFRNRAGWAKTYLSQAWLIEYVSRGRFKITERGRELLNSNNAIDNVVLKQYKEFVEFLHRSHPVVYVIDGEEGSGKSGRTGENTEASEETPEERLDTAHRTINESLKAELLQKIKSCSPAFFENLVIDLLLKMGYGGSRKDAGSAIGKSGDGGIDGIINEDKLGLDTIYVQAKKWDKTVGAGEVRDFAGALLGRKARKGIMIATSSFPKSAYDYVKNLEQKIILIDGDKLTELMIENNAGIHTERAYEIKRIDLDYFEEE